MNKSRLTTIIFIAIIMFFAITPIILPKTYAKFDYEHVDEITDINNIEGKIFKVGTAMNIPNLTVEYYIQGELVDRYITNERFTGGDCTYDDNLGHKVCGPRDYIYENNIIGTNGARSLSKYSKYWYVVEANDFYYSDDDAYFYTIKLRAYFDKVLDTPSIKKGKIFPPNTPIDACQTIKYYNKNKELLLVSQPSYDELNYLDFETNYLNNFYRYKDDDEYYLGRNIDPSLLMSEEVNWRIIDYTPIPQYNGCTMLSVQETTESEAYEVKHEKNTQFGTFVDTDDTENSLFVKDEKVHFSLQPKPGYRVSKVNIKNESTNEIVSYTKNKNNYEFSMPESNVFISVEYKIAKYSINVEIKNETEDININIEDLTQIDSGEEVKFKVTPITGYKLNNVTILDEDNNEIEYTTTDNKNYTFIMPSSDVTIVPSYEKVKNEVTIEDNKNTKEITIEVNDATAVVYEDTVRFKIEPADGYEVEYIEIIDENNNKINYKKTSNKNEYEFIMPATNVKIIPKYRLTSKLPNPNTKRQILLIVISVIILSIMTLLYIKKKKRLA